MATKNNILELLETATSYLSGEEIAKTLKISRNSVWKAVNQLKKEGHKIIAQKNKGYLLQAENNIISLEGIGPLLQESNLKNNLFIYDSLNSTNDFAKELISKGINSPSIIVANQQTAGKGRFGKHFYSPADDGIYLSYVFKPNDNYEIVSIITVLVSYIVTKTLKDLTNLDLKIKWVNDIYLNNKKLAGILTESISNIETNTIDWIIIGIGINYKFSNSNAPDDLQTIATGLNTEQISRNQIIANLINNLYTYINNYNFQDVITEYKNLSNVIGREIVIYHNNQKEYAKAISINDYGHLVVETEDKQQKTLTYGDISIRWSN